MKMSSMVRPASMSFTSACRSAEDSFEVSTRNVVGPKRAVIFCNWASPGAELLFLVLDFWALEGTGVTPNRMISTKDASGLMRVSFDETNDSKTDHDNRRYCRPRIFTRIRQKKIKRL